MLKRSGLRQCSFRDQPALGRERKNFDTHTGSRDTTCGVNHMDGNTRHGSLFQQVSIVTITPPQTSATEATASRRPAFPPPWLNLMQLGSRRGRAATPLTEVFKSAGISSRFERLPLTH
jgi:hypothetical protein